MYVLVSAVDVLVLVVDKCVLMVDVCMLVWVVMWACIWIHLLCFSNTD